MNASNVSAEDPLKRARCNRLTEIVACGNSQRDGLVDGIDAARGGELAVDSCRAQLPAYDNRRGEIVQLSWWGSVCNLRDKSRFLSWRTRLESACRSRESTIAKGDPAR